MEDNYDILMDAAKLLEADNSKRSQMRATQLRLIAKELLATREERGPADYEVRRLTKLHREAHAALNLHGIPRNVDGGEDYSLAMRIDFLAAAQPDAQRER